MSKVWLLWQITKNNLLFKATVWRLNEFVSSKGETGLAERVFDWTDSLRHSKSLNCTWSSCKLKGDCLIYWFLSTQVVRLIKCAPNHHIIDSYKVQVRSLLNREVPLDSVVSYVGSW